MGERSLKIPLLGIVFLCWFAAAAFPGEDIRVEGIVHDPAAPGQSVAILNGVLVKQGDHIGPYKIVSIGPDAVLGVDESSGKEIRWAPAVKTPEPPALKKKPLSGVKSLDEPKANPPEETLPGSGNSFQWNPLNVLSSAEEMQAISEIHQIYRAALVYHETRGGEETLDLKKLGGAGLLSRELASGRKGKYGYRLTVSRSGFEINADPVDSVSNLRHFYIGQDGMLRAEPKAKATAKSPIHEY